MIVKTFKVRKKGLVMCGGILIALLVILVVFGVVHKFAGKNYTMKTESDRQKFMSEMGWEVSEEYTSCKVISIPEDFNDTYESYNELQKEQGFNLKKYRGEMVEIYTYEVYNYPEKSDNVVINLLVFEGKLIGGDVSCSELDGFMQGLKNSNPDTASDVKANENSESRSEDENSSEAAKKKSNKNSENSSSDSDSQSDESDTSSSDSNTGQSGNEASSGESESVSEASEESSTN